MNDSYKTIKDSVSYILFKDRNSKFYGFAFPIKGEEEVKTYLSELRKMHHSARHWCYAFQLGNEISGIYYRYNDDGEPSNSAGAPIYGQIQSFEVTDLLVVVVRYFGGTKLGVSGLINAYKTTAELTLTEAIIIAKHVVETFKVNYPYSLTTEVMRVCSRDSVEIISQKFDASCEMLIQIKLSKANKIFEELDKIYGIECKKIVL
ncbi:IMPACT family protein [Aegicerativicinus sediminis]|uniref:IMPACT family protein n=1 Tax=Aegicerativicinus sediminis TaxID=2893202 RepID=UPI001E471F12|nr:YigZ family protein [Aegicerativicinus sediminis]